jgi:hypothetical protein
MNSESNSEPIPNQYSNENPNEFANKFGIKFENKFGINSVKKVAEFEEKYPRLFADILGLITLEYLADEPVLMVEFFSQLLDKINEIERQKNDK